MASLNEIPTKESKMKVFENLTIPRKQVRNKNEKYTWKPPKPQKCFQFTFRISDPLFGPQEVSHFQVPLLL
ncbi:uncharacterized protein G2W53_035504 [Senna tora]|uniref:Uncharacterized protein n=1 Tax=Senna tora TaxID=362788 RepID=A0A834W7L5_9FABA|nr:uncharacterized protein G2W53_035504 [Senna tora]